MTSRATNGSETKMVAIAIPGRANMTRVPRFIDRWPNHPSRAVEDDPRQADHDGGDAERRAQQGVRQRLAAEPVADDGRCRRWC